MTAGFFLRGTALALGLSLAQGLGAQAALQARVHVYQPRCSQVDAETVQAALQEAGRLLGGACAIRLSLTAWTSLPLDSDWCHLPAGPAARRTKLKALARLAKGANPSALALFLLPSREDERLSWALVDVSAQSNCDSPQEARFLDRFGSLFITDLSFELRQDAPAGGPSRPALLLAHEALHSLTQRGHPSHAPRGSVMADHVADMGPAIAADWCACARRSPYLQRLVAPPVKP